MSSNQFILQPGRYVITAYIPIQTDVDGYAVRIWNATDGILVARGASGHINSGNERVTVVVIGSLAFSSGTKAIEIQQIQQDGNSSLTYGEGAGIAGVQEIYTQVYIRKLF